MPFVPVLVFLAIVLVIALLSSCYRKAPPTEALVISGFGHKEPKVISGRGSVVIPVLQRVDKILMHVMKVDVKTPKTGVKTSEGVPLFLDAVVTIKVYSDTAQISEQEIKDNGYKSKAEYIRSRQQAAISNFLGMKEVDITNKVNDILQGNLREIVATMTVMDVLTKRKEFAERVMENARPDLSRLGLFLETFNIQEVTDAYDDHGRCHGVVEAIGVQREMEVKREAEKARAAAEKDIEIARAEAQREAAERKAEADRLTAEAAQKLELRRAELKAQEDKAKADAEAAGLIQAQIQEKTRRQAEADVAIAAQEKEIIRAEKEAEVKQRRLDAEIRRQAEAEKYRAQQQADAAKYAAEAKAAAEKKKRELDAEAELFEISKKAEAKKLEAEAELVAAQKRAAAIEAEGKATAEAIRAKGIAEAESIEKKAEAQQKMGEASKMELWFNVLPDVVKAYSSILNGVDHVTLYGTDTAPQFMQSVAQGFDQVMNTIKDSTGKVIDPSVLAGAVVGSNLTSQVANKTVDAETANK